MEGQLHQTVVRTRMGFTVDLVNGRHCPLGLHDCLNGHAIAIIVIRALYINMRTGIDPSRVASEHWHGKLHNNAGKQYCVGTVRM